MLNDGNAIWSKCLLYIKSQISEQGYKTWFIPIVAKDFKEETLTIQVSSQFFNEWLEEHYLLLLKQAVQQEKVVHGKLEFKPPIYTIESRVKFEKTKKQKDIKCNNLLSLLYHKGINVICKISTLIFNFSSTVNSWL